MKKTVHWTMLAILGLFSPAVLALGLGSAVVESYLGQPLDVRVQLISHNEDELQSVTANLASAADFELLGLSLAAISVPLEFEVVTDSGKPYVHITSNLNVNEPVVQVVMEVVWASGRMLREYTLFLDPPTIASPAPPVTVAPAPVKTPSAEQQTVTVAPIQKNVPSREDSVTAAASQEVESGQRQSSASLGSGDEVYGPVARGETLWGIARKYSEGSGYSVNQAMLALQRKNPEAFIKGNINMLKRGAILRLPAYNELAELTSQEALQEVLQQEEEYRTGVRSVASEISTPTVADSGGYQASSTEPEPETDLQEEQGHLELVPPAEQQTQESQPTGAVGAQDTSEVESLHEELARTEEELLNAKQENTYLTERIKALEDEVAEREKQAAQVQDSNLANMESKLAEDRESGKPEAPVAITPGGEKQPWYAGMTPLLIGIAVILIGLVTWFLRRRSTGTVRAWDTEEEQLAGDAGGVAITAGSGDSEGETVVQPIPEPFIGSETAMESEAEFEPQHDLEAEFKPQPDFEAEFEPQPDFEAEFEPQPVNEPEVEPEPEQQPVIEPEPEPALETEPPAPPRLGEIEQGEEPTLVFGTDELAAEIEAEPELDFDEIEEASGEGESDPEIKLDLARAYLSLGDREASKSMLDEVLKTGNEAQKAEARQMLDEL